jgi:hypothetical protein
MVIAMVVSNLTQKREEKNVLFKNNLRFFKGFTQLIHSMNNLVKTIRQRKKPMHRLENHIVKIKA